MISYTWGIEMKLVKSNFSAPNKYKDLREVMDYTRDFSMFYSGVEYEVYLQGCYDMGVRNFLMSYEYIRKRSLKQVTEKFDETIHLFIDSGAYTYINDPKFHDYDIKHWESHIEKYLKWAEANKKFIFAIANLDLDNILGGEQIKEWNRKYFEPFMLRTGIPVCFIWHDCYTLESFEQYCRRYPYVGITAVNDESAGTDINYFKEKLQIAEKHNAVLHGMGMTRTSLLPQLPFYTVDSTSWKTGMRYGVIPTWNGRMIKSCKRDEFDSKTVPILSSYPDIKFDFEKLRDYYEPEVIRASVYAYIKAEEFIIQRLQSLEYWKKVKAIKNSLDSLPADFFPPPEWTVNVSNAKLEDIQAYARKMNINPDLGQQTLNSVREMTIFLNWDNEDYSETKKLFIEEKGWFESAHDFYINRIRETDEERIQDLIQFFKDNLEGRNEFLLQMGTNFDRRQLEREEYLDDADDDTEIEDVPENEVLRAFHALLPTPKDATENESGEMNSTFDNLDDEVYQEMGIIPVRDDTGKVLRYEKRAIRKNIYSKKFPKFACDNCFVGAKCPEYKAGYVCAYSKIFKKFDTRNMTDIIQAVQSITGYDMERLQKAMIFEQLGGGIDGNVSAMIETNLKHLLLLKDLYSNASTETIRQTRVVRSDGSMESVTQISNPQNGGILSKLLSGLAVQQNDTGDSKTSNSGNEIDISSAPPQAEETSNK